jgi:transcriptional regulator with XRE-family HTH domain
MFHSNAPLAAVFATRLERIRRFRGLSIDTLAAKSGHEPSFIRAAENASIPILLDAIDALAVAVGIPMPMLLRRDFDSEVDAPNPQRFPDFIPSRSRAFTKEFLVRMLSGEDVGLTLDDVEQLAKRVKVAEETICCCRGYLPNVLWELYRRSDNYQRAGAAAPQRTVH